MLESVFTSFDSNGLFKEFRRLDNEMRQLFGHSPWAAGIRVDGHGSQSSE
jgi:hypothetical protein